MPDLREFEMTKMLSKCFLIVVTLLTLLPTTLPVFAATTTNNFAEGNGYKIYPVRTDLILNPGTADDVNIYIENISSSEEKLQVIVNDFEARSDESGAPALLLNGQTDTQHGLKQYITILNPSLDILPGQMGTITARISVPKSAVGGYYSAVRVAPAGLVGDKNINVAASVGALILAKVSGNIVDHVSIAGFQIVDSKGNAGTFFTSNKGLQAVVRFQNEGNVQEEPFGKVELKKGTKVLGNYVVNPSIDGFPSNVLPDSIRKFNISLSNVGSFGKYTVVGNFGYGTNGQLLSAQTTFFVLPVPYIVICVVVLIILILLLFGIPKAIKKYNQRIISKARR
jgi:hypothetical protein